MTKYELWLKCLEIAGRRHDFDLAGRADVLVQEFEDRFGDIYEKPAVRPGKPSRTPKPSNG